MFPVDDPLRAPTGLRSETLPPAWHELLGLARLGNHAGLRWTLYNEREAYRVALIDGEYLVVAECEGAEYLLYRLDPQADQLFYLESHDGVPKLFQGNVAALLGIGK